MEEFWKLPPKIKVLEALGAIADGRVSVENNKARVSSSTGEKNYTVIFQPPDRIKSDDNGSVFKGYLGYPAIAFLMLKGLLPYDEQLAEKLKGIPWKELNEKYKDYRKVEFIILKQRRLDQKRVETFEKEVLQGIKRKWKKLA
ncbi:MAG: hypothetical protein DRP12_03815 [Candidatus Aenigmatarchaeota archaeon]|nr:MAG: hypothetical protein DRP12_03815 [Candidatus Aenigmarchaeota archaeon]